MPDTFQNYTNGVESPARRSYAITPHNTNEITVATRAIMVSAAGTIVGQLLEDTVDTTIAVLPGVIYPLRYKLIKTSSSATGIVGLA